MKIENFTPVPLTQILFINLQHPSRYKHMATLVALIRKSCMN